MTLYWAPLSFCLLVAVLISFVFNAPAPTEIYTLSLHDALPISSASPAVDRRRPVTRSASSPVAVPAVAARASWPSMRLAALPASASVQHRRNGIRVKDQHRPDQHGASRIITNKNADTAIGTGDH